jgi:hypothetical protein
MSRFDFNAHRNEMDRMGRQVRRQVALVQFISLVMLIAIVAAGAWLLLHPEAVGSFFGRIVAGFGAEVHHG